MHNGSRLQSTSSGARAQRCWWKSRVSNVGEVRWKSGVESRRPRTSYWLEPAKYPKNRIANKRYCNALRIIACSRTMPAWRNTVQSRRYIFTKTSLFAWKFGSMSLLCEASTKHWKSVSLRPENPRGVGNITLRGLVPATHRSATHRLCRSCPLARGLA